MVSEWWLVRSGKIEIESGRILASNFFKTDMATYVYETIPQNADEAPEQFELQQSMMDAPLTEHPETGVPVRRVISGGYGFTGSAKEASGGDCCSGSSCGCV